MKRSHFRFLERLRVRWAEVDMQKIVFNGHYLMYIDTAVATWWRVAALPYDATMAQLGGDLFVRHAALDYAASARYDDVLHAGVRWLGAGVSSLRFEAAVFRGEQALVTGSLVYVYADPAVQRPLPVPTALRDAFAAFEAGEPMVEVCLGDWEALGAAASGLRKDVFIDEQGVPADLEWDGEDAAAVHALARNRLGLAVGTGRLLQPAPGVARIGRMAVHRGARGGGVGRQVLDALVRAAQDRGDHSVVLHAQCTALDFYKRAGFVPRGEAFEEAGIAHVEMVLGSDASR